MSASTSPQAQIQIVSRTDYTEQHLVNVPFPSTPLAPLSVRVRPSLLSLIVNTLSCASHPEIKIGWWDVHSLPSDLPHPYNDSTKYGRIGVWGWATVLESTLGGIEVGAHVYGFFPIATLPLDLQLESTNAPGIYREVSPGRASAMRTYNTFELHAASAVSSEDSQALDALAKPTFRLGYLFARYTFNPSRCVHPSSSDVEWRPADAELKNAVIVLAAATSKSALSLAYMLQRPDQASKPARVVALTSKASASYALATGWYSDVVTYDEAERIAQLGINGRKVVIIDFGAREEAAQRALAAIREHATKTQFLIVGGEQKKDAIKFTDEVVETAIQAGMILVHTGLMIENAEKVLGKGGNAGEAKLNEEYDRIWGEFKQNGGFPGMRITWGNGLDEYVETYKKMCEGEVRADTGFVFKM